MSYIVDDFRYSRASGDWGAFAASIANLAIVFGIPATFVACAIWL